MIGFHTNAFVWAGVTDLRQVADYALGAGFSCLEVGPGFDLDLNTFEQVQKQIPISNFIYCRNFIDDDRQSARQEKAELWRRMDFAAALGVDKMVISTGISQSLSIPKSGGCDPLASLEPAVAFLTEALERAERQNLTLLIENCPMYRNIATSPVLWKAIFDRLPTPRLGLCYDPSHFVWQMIEPIAPIREFGSRIGHVHLKDTALDKGLIAQVGILHNVGKERGFFPNQWWRHTLIGGGEIDWAAFKQALEDISYTGAFSFEMEDYQYECQPEKVMQGLSLQRQWLRDHWSI